MATIPVTIQPGAKLPDVNPKLGDTIEWRSAGGKTFVLCFIPTPHGHGHPLIGGHLIVSDINGIAKATVRSEEGLHGKKFRYFVLITSSGAEDYVHGVHSPPEMVIQ